MAGQPSHALTASTPLARLGGAASPRPPQAEEAALGRGHPAGDSAGVSCLS